MLRDIRTGAKAQMSIKAGVDKTANIIKSTMGPLGRYVSIDFDTFSWPLITNDGVTVANSIYLKDKYENIGAKYVRQAAQKTNDVAGDGTTTASVLVQAFIEEGLRQLSLGISPITLRRQIESAVKLVIQNIQDQTVVIKQGDTKSLTDIATISCRDSELGKMIATLISEIGADGVITVEDTPLAETIVERAEGLKVRGGLLSPFFVNNRAFQQAVYEDTPVVVTDSSITQAGDVIPIMENLYKEGHKKAVLIAAQVEGNGLATIIQNSLQKKFDILPLRVVAYGPIGEGYLRDVCSATGATLLTEKDGKKLKDFLASDAGQSEKVIASAHEITFIGGAGDSQARVEELKAQIPNVKQLEEESLKERIAKLQSKTASIKVGGVIDSEREEIKKRVEDAVNATKAALSDGIVTGGGAALFRASQLEGESYGEHIVRKACLYPLKQIAKNSDVDLDKGELVRILKDEKLTYNFLTGEVVNAFETGIIDPSKVITTALKNAVSAALLFLVTDAAVITLEDSGEEL